ncbi:ectoine/hydroxyectoine ABC transporter substrate-binding protein EhuB [Egicoccus sp. AB-alg6-2]|uniref:ectoine/hydroxyectoine ABC transporter substrate-binding protein EhuB n=1 Tax=Egicoccus sp. AB-alg6-2 TaxID=3242692 RepID=UPI00359E43EC
MTACGVGDDETTTATGIDDGAPTDDDAGDETDDATAQGGDGGDTLARLQEQGSITVGIANEVPYGYEDDGGNITGEAPEVARVVLAELGIDEMDAQIVDFNALISGLQAGQFDMIAAGMYINADRAAQILFSDPDYCVGEAFAVEAGNPHDLSDFASVIESPDATIAILSGAVEEGYADIAGVPDDQIELFNDVNAQYDALEAGRVDAVVGTTLTVLTQVEAMDGYEATESFFPVDEDGEEILGCGGFGFRNDDQEFRDAFNDELNRLQDEGELLPIIADFGFAEEDIERAQQLTVDDLTG